jgi:hypothetical protein
MKTIQRLRAVSYALALAISSASVLAQAGVSAGIFVSGVAGSPQPGMPYTAQYKTTTVHKLANGVTITRSSTSLLARDSEGRTRQEQSLDFGEPNANRKFVNVSDPSSRTSLHWNTSVPEVYVMHLLSPDEMRARVEATKAQRSPLVLQKTSGEIHAVVSSGSTGSPSVAFASSSSSGLMTTLPVQKMEPFHNGMQRESLGSRTINGVVAEGERITNTMPAGAIGNDQPLVSTSEIWTSPDLNLVVLEIHDDPQNGTTTRELVNLDRGEPDPALFRAPEGYTVKDQSEPK